MTTANASAPEAQPQVCLLPCGYKLLFVTAEPHPTFRSDVKVLFGKALPTLGVRCDLFTQALPGQDDAPWPAGQTWLAPATRSKWRKQWLMFRHDLRLFNLARQGYDAVQVRDRMLAGAIGLLAARLAGVKFFYWSSYPKPESKLLVSKTKGWRAAPMRWLVNRLRAALGDRLLYGWVLPRADHVFVQSEAMKDAFATRGVAPDRITAVPMGIDITLLDQLPALPPEWSARLTNRRVVVYAGALDRVRQPELMIEAMPPLLARFPDALLLMVGGASDHEDQLRLEERVRALRLDDRVLFTGWVSSPLALAFMNAAEVGLAMIPRGPLYDVSSPTKLAEYFALGLPVVANDLPDQAHVLAQSGAGVPVAFSAVTMADAVCALFAQPEAARAAGMRGRQWVLTHRSYTALAARLAKVYLVLLRDRAPDPRA